MMIIKCGRCERWALSVTVIDQDSEMHSDIWCFNCDINPALTGASVLGKFAQRGLVLTYKILYKLVSRTLEKQNGRTVAVIREGSEISISMSEESG